MSAAVWEHACDTGAGPAPSHHGALACVESSLTDWPDTDSPARLPDANRLKMGDLGVIMGQLVKQLEMKTDDLYLVS